MSSLRQIVSTSRRSSAPRRSRTSATTKLVSALGTLHRAVRQHDEAISPRNVSDALLRRMQSAVRDGADTRKRKVIELLVGISQIADGAKRSIDGYSIDQLPVLHLLLNALSLSPTAFRDAYAHEYIREARKTTRGIASELRGEHFTDITDLDFIDDVADYMMQEAAAASDDDESVCCSL
jgi:hypothetical protein